MAVNGEPTAQFRGRALTQDAYIWERFRESQEQCDCGASHDGGHAPDCNWVLSAQEYAADFEQLSSTEETSK